MARFKTISVNEHGIILLISFPIVRSQNSYFVNNLNMLYYTNLIY